MKEFNCNRMAQLRRMEKVSYARMSEQLTKLKIGNVSITMLRRVEIGDIEPKLDVLMAIADFFRVDYKELILREKGRK